MKTIIIFVIFAYSLFFFDVSAQTLRVVPYICDSAILQRESPIIIKGEATPKSEVVVTLDRITLKTDAAYNGDWMVVFPPKKASFNPLTLEVYSANEQIKFNNILIGDVWFAGGQSNMVFKVAGMTTEDRSELIKQANFPDVRQYRRRTVVSGKKRVDHLGDKKWSSAKDSTVLDWSAIAYLFARDLHERYNIPIGIINCAHGSSSAEAWISPDKFQRDVKLRQSIGALADGIDSLHRNPSSLYQNMLSVFEGVPIKGVIWYQGENNSRFAQYYQYVFSSLIDDWRVFFNNKDLPFIFAQLSSFRVGSDSTNESWAQLRWAQYLVAKEKDNSFMVVTSDCGDAKDIHPKDKAPVAKRFVDVALENVYEQTKGPSFIKLPEFALIKVDAVEVIFGGFKGAVVAKSEIDIFVSGADGRFVKCDATIKNNVLTIDTRAINKPNAVRYAWSNVNSLSLYHNNGTPVSPFELKIKNHE